jgi:methionyl-tRNA synthetase
MVHRYRGGVPSPYQVNEGDRLVAAWRAAPGRVDAALADFDFRLATAAVWRVVEEANRYVEEARPWQLARTDAAALDQVLGVLVAACRAVGELLVPFLPAAAARISTQCTPVDGRLPEPRPLFPRVSG